jgi:hypothetical protein
MSAVPDPQGLPGLADATAGRSGKSYRDFLAQHPDFNPWGNLDQYAGQGAGDDPIFRFAFAKTNDWARAHGYNDGSDIPLAQRQQVFMANVERARQQWTDLEAQTAWDSDARNGMQGVTWATSKANRIPSTGWAYQAGTGGKGSAWEAQGQAGGAAGPWRGVPWGGAQAGGGAGNRATLGTASGGGGARGRNGPAAASDNEWGDASGGGSGQRGGNNVSAPLLPTPPLGSGLATGAVALGDEVANGAASGVPRTPVGGNVSGAGAQILNDSPEQAWYYLLRRAGIDPNRVTKFSNYAKELLSPALSSYMNARRTLGGSVDDTTQYVDDFDAMLGGNKLFGGLADIGRKGLAAGQDYLDTAQPQEAQNFFLQMLGLEGLGAAPLQASAQDYLTRSLVKDFENTGVYSPYGVGADKFGSYAKDSGYYSKLKQLGLVP